VKRIARAIDRLRLTADIGLHRHGPWGSLLAVLVAVLSGLALFGMPRLEARLAGQQATLQALQARAANPKAPPPALVSASQVHYTTFRETLADASQVLPTIKTILDSAQRHHLLVTRAEYLRGRDANAQAETLQMTVPVRGRYQDVRRWIEEILATQPSLAVNEIGFKREDIGVTEVETKVRLTLWHFPATPSSGAADAGKSRP
jgi:hypothetical protein